MMIFTGHELGHYILGEPDTLQSFNRERIHRFMARQYHPSEMVFFSFGKTSFEKVVHQVEKYFSVTQEMIPPKKRVSPAIFVPQVEKMEKNTAQTHVMLGWPALHMHHPQRYALFMLNNILGGGSMNSRLNVSLREKHGLAYNVESNVTLYSDTGLFSIYFACDHRQREKCIRLIRKEIDKVMTTDLTPMQLSLAKKQWKGQLGIASENNENAALSMAKHYLHFHDYTPLEEVFSMIDALTSKEVKDVAEEVFATSPFELMYV